MLSLKKGTHMPWNREYKSTELIISPFWQIGKCCQKAYFNKQLFLLLWLNLGSRYKYELLYKFGIKCPITFTGYSYADSKKLKNEFISKV